MKNILLGVAVALFLAVGPLLTLATTEPTEGGPVLVLSFASAEQREAELLALGGTIIGPTSAPFATLVSFAAHGRKADLIESGGHWIIEAGPLAELCGV
ncbi:MAG: hypothetical protein AAGG56_16340 [Pseudomonadota bacterium]